ncbi:hypothetical protein PHMEG_0009784 [Phytophthora megakarya]|uniref:ZSWIM1/3 RNaseH-like domain-containing protein n=1 Tax=Phytophthora megakarya TaxID=4795 RepID=A0A225WHE7_9STRA|nr:hypothetical protein PHMEG_0009784 [Phytophthora megakarya]
MVHDTFSARQFVQHAFIDAETKENMLKAASVFKQNTQKWREIHKHLIFVQLDKDVNEIEVLEDEFPQARVLLCHFNVLKWSKTIKADDQYGLNKQLQTELLMVVQEMKKNTTRFGMALLPKYARYQKDKWPIKQNVKKRKLIKSKKSAPKSKRSKNLQEIVSAQANATSNSKHDGFFSDIELYTDTSTDEVHPFEIYFMTNWDACEGRWVTCFRKDLPYMGNNINNRLESGWRKRKPDINM